MDMRDIAKIAGVSSATVSRVINGSSLVRPETAERVQRVIEKTNFVPNGSATTLKYGRSSTFGLIIPDITNPFFPELIRCFEAILVSNDQDMLMATTDFQPVKLQRTIRRMLIRKVDAVALLAAEIETQPIESLIHNRVPLVTLDRRSISRGVSDVAVEYLSGMKQAVEHLKRLGHRRIAYIGGSLGLTISEHRVEGFRTAIEEAGLKYDPKFVLPGNYRISGGEAGMREILAMKTRPTAILATNDLTAIGAMRVARAQGVGIPEEISIIGFDDIELCEIIYPALTTLRLPRQELAQALFRALDVLAKHPHGRGHQSMVSTTLVIRDSTGPAPRDRKPVGKQV